MTQVHSYGDYGFRPMVSAFKADLASIPISESMFGLPLQIQYLYGFLRTEDGTMYSPERKFNGSLTGGLYFMAYDGKTLEMHPGTGGGARGELKRKMNERAIKQGYTWLEHFPDRIKDAGRAAKLG